jgi:hypothetical protein
MNNRIHLCIRIGLIAALLVSVSACTSHLKEAKLYYTQGEDYARVYDTQKATASFKRARELGLPTEQIFRDNDNQIVYCYQELKKLYQPEQWVSFEALYLDWVKRWGWKGPETPTWQMR